MFGASANYIRQAAASSGSTERSRKQLESSKQQRQRKHQQNEQERPADKRITTRSDLESHAHRFVTRSTFSTYARTVRLFAEFSEDVLNLPPGSGDQYFQENGPLPCTKIMRQFLFYLADGGHGRGPDGRITRQTAVCHAIALFGAIKYCNRQLESDVREQVMTWARYELTEELGLNKDLAISKPIAHRADVSLVLRTMMSPLGLRQVLSMRVLLNLAIFINLIVDCCSRIHELVSTERYPDQYLRWKHFKIYVFKDDETSAITVAGLIKINNMKGFKDKPDTWKEIPLMLMPSSLWLEDSLRLLIYAALIDGHIVGASNWEEFEQLISSCETNTGILVPFHESCLELPLIPAIDHSTGTVLKDKHAKADIIPWHLKRLGMLCGFKNILKSHAFRRGAAYNLETAVSTEVRTWAMGHGPGSKTFLNSYKAQTSTIDIQGIMHGFGETRDVLKMSSMSLGRSKDPLLSLSARGEDNVMADPRIREANNKCSETLDRLTEKYPTIESAKRDGSNEFANWQDTRRKAKLLTRHLREAELQKESNAHFQAHETLKPQVSSEADNVDDPTRIACAYKATCTENALVHAHASMRSDQTTSSETTIDVDLIDPAILSPEDFAMSAGVSADPEGFDAYEVICAENAFVHDHSPTRSNQTTSSYSTIDMNLIDPAILSPEDFAMSAGRAPDDIFEGVPAEPEGFDAEEVGESIDIKDLDASVGGDCLHHAYRHHPRQRLAEGFHRESQVCRDHRFDNLLQDTCVQPLSNGELADRLIPFFKTMHPLERYGNLEPEPSTFTCPVCLDDQGSKNDFEQHVVSCRTKNAVANAELDWAYDLQPKMALPCTWQVTSRKGNSQKMCSKTFTDLKKFTRHVLAHTYHNEVCKFAPCWELTEQPRYEDLDAWSDHVATVHGLTWVGPSSLVFFCSFCDDFVSFGISGPSERVKHYRDHIPEAFRMIEKLGYNEVYSTVGGTEIISVRNPMFCIFCVHDANLPPDQRLSLSNERTSCNGKPERRNHWIKHFASIKDLLVPCPASVAAGADAPMCRSTQSYSQQELEQHLIQVHRLFRFEGLSTAVLLKPRSKASKRKLKTQVVASSGVEEVPFHDDDGNFEDCEGDENEQNMTTSSRVRTPVKPKRQHLAEVTSNTSPQRS